MSVSTTILAMVARTISLESPFNSQSIGIFFNYFLTLSRWGRS